MTNPTTVNPQITDAITQTNLQVVGGSAAQSMAMVYQTLAHSISLSMQNATAIQNAMSQLGTSIVAAACTRILTAPIASAPGGGGAGGGGAGGGGGPAGALSGLGGGGGGGGLGGLAGQAASIVAKNPELLAAV